MAELLITPCAMCAQEVLKALESAGRGAESLGLVGLLPSKRSLLARGNSSNVAISGSPFVDGALKPILPKKPAAHAVRATPLYENARLLVSAVIAILCVLTLTWGRRRSF